MQNTEEYLIHSKSCKVLAINHLGGYMLQEVFEPGAEKSGIIS